ncbi:MAG: U32 family peptidase [Tissierellia bacterium]|nr:U32 family peptidase [Tissierellia bacterium]
MRKIELLAPAGDFEKLKTAIDYGADAVYLGGDSFGLRKASKNFSLDEIAEGVKYSHERGRKVYVTMNIVPHDKDMVGAADYAKSLVDVGVDAIIVSDLGMMSLLMREVPDIKIHISTQASVTNYETVMFYYNLGIRRIVFARELSLAEIKEIRSKVPDDMDIECFVHGAMCISYSGRCLISNYMTGRDANQGDCAQGCRYKYNLVEEKRPGEYFPIIEDDEGTFILNSKDLCMLPYIPEMVDAGITSFKIEGRVKSSYYIATVLSSYRRAIDDFIRLGDNYKYDPSLMDEIKKASHRDFTTGFYFGKPDESAQNYGTSSYVRGYDFIGIVKDYDRNTGIAIIEQRNRFFPGEEIEIFGPRGYYKETINGLTDLDGNPKDVANIPQELVKIKVDNEVQENYMLRRKNEE